MDDISIHIALLIALENQHAASKVLDGLLKACQSLHTSPQRGRLCPEFKVGLRRLVVGKHLIFYRVSDARVEVARVIHGARDLAQLFNED